MWVWCGDPSGLCWTPDVWCARSPWGSYHGHAHDIFRVLLDCGSASQAAGYTGDAPWSCSHHCCPCAGRRSTEQSRGQIVVCFSCYAGTTGACWLKKQEEWDGSPDLAATNLKVNVRGDFTERFRKEHQSAPQRVPWVSGLVKAT